MAAVDLVLGEISGAGVVGRREMGEARRKRRVVGEAVAPVDVVTAGCLEMRDVELVALPVRGIAVVIVGDGVLIAGDDEVIARVSIGRNSEGGVAAVVRGTAERCDRRRQ